MSTTTANPQERVKGLELKEDGAFGHAQAVADDTKRQMVDQMLGNTPKPVVETFHCSLDAGASLEFCDVLFKEGWRLARVDGGLAELVWKR